MNAVGDEPAVLSGRGPVVDPHVRVAGAGLDQRAVPQQHVVFRVRPAGEQGYNVHPHDWLVANQRHHLLDPGSQADLRADVYIRGVVGSQREHPAPVVSLLYQLLGNGMGVRLAIVGLDDRPGARDLRNELDPAHPGVLGGNPLPRVRQIIGRDEALGGGVADVHHRPAAGAGRVACGHLRSAGSRAPRLLAGDGRACGRWPRTAAADPRGCMGILIRHMRHHATAGGRLCQAEQRPGDSLADDRGRHVGIAGNDGRHQRRVCYIAPAPAPPRAGARRLRRAVPGRLSGPFPAAITRRACPLGAKRA